MAYNTTTWQADSNTKANNATISSNLYRYKSLQVAIWDWDDDDSTGEQFLPLAGNIHDNGVTPPASIDDEPSTRYVWGTKGNLVKAYFVPTNWNPNDTVGTANIITFKVYKYTPNNATNTGDIGTIGNWTTLETVVLANDNLQAENRGIIVNFTEADCAFAAGDLMAISMDCSVDVASDDDNTNLVFILKEDWNDIISSNV